MLMDKIEVLIESRVKGSDCTHCFVVPGSENMIDLVHPLTGRTVIYGRTLKDVREEPGYETAELMLVDDFLREKAARQDTPITWEETSEEKFHEMLEVLPPAAMSNGGFLVGEPWDHHALTGAPRYAAYKQINDQYYAASRPLTKREFKEEVQS